MRLPTKYFIPVILLLFALTAGCRILGIEGESTEIAYKDPVHYNISDLEFVKQQLENEDTLYQEAYEELIIKANKALNSFGYSVVTKEGSAPNGDKQEYVSRGRYWWPNPETEDGLPYVQKDGKTNPEIYEFDRTSLSNLRNDIEVLTIAYFLTENEKYSKKAISLIDQWFIDEETRMKPNLKFAQGIPGIAAGRAEGIIDGLDFYRIINYLPILQKSRYWSEEISEGIGNWYFAYYNWLLNHPFGEKEKNTTNNHGTWYDVQVATYAYFFDDEVKLNEVLERVRQQRIPEQIDPIGRQPHEVLRTQSLRYSTYNLRAFSILAKIANQTKKKSALNAAANVNSPSTTPNMWNYKNSKSGSIESALQYVIPSVNGGGSWNYEQISDYNSCSLIPVIKRIYDFQKEEVYYESYKAILENNSVCRNKISFILYPFF